mmetsp:Transcript_23127/g.35209  ORF Transcript_23127/g.35209 Transcript_23127/m.35209 type:complete len:405 (-) Transcript_23127:85-1299(-)|eukprot:CAMPEP_0177722512 /NCGR_PEP_ID=MMETSP0484_2-20121128/17718_1 /TAXON_ID=354590 /ORGANISM="Rhodomonas lens, Strain RHODO" /LENGTH=404 /DNA_ID=CAMNT_0019234885 /DNA_START=99 /DNA_END=1313 /DNA_ORIENTATION=-
MFGARFLAGLAIVCAIGSASAKGLYEKDSLVEKLNELNFKTFIKKQDSMNHVKLIEFYKDDCANCKSFEKEYNDLAKQFKGIIKVTAVDCNSQKKICDEYSVKEFPTLKVIPPGGFGVQDYAGERTAKAIYPWVLKFHQHFVEKVTSEDLDAFLNKNAGKYKALLFTDKGKTPLIWRGLSVDLHNKMTLGVVQKEEKGVCSRYKVTKFPTILVVKPGQKKPIKFEEKVEYQELFEFLNRYQETFAMEQPGADEELAAKKPWLSESVPELTKLSAEDICYGTENVCVIVAATPTAEGKLDKGVYDEIAAAKSKFNPGNGKYQFMWLNTDREKAFVSATGLEAATTTILALRTGKRTRFAKSEAAFSEKALSEFLQRLPVGDVQYKPLKDGPPALEEIAAPEEKKK